MADPTGYEVSYNFGGYQASNPSLPLPAAAVDNELAEIATSVAALVAAIKDIRRSDGALTNEIVTYDSLELGLQLLVDPTNGQAVAAAVATTEANAALTDADRIAAAASAADALTQATAAAASAGSVNLALFLPKAGNLANIGSPDTARANIEAPKIDGSDLTGRLAPFAVPAVAVTDWNNVINSGWTYANGAANAPASGTEYVVQTIAVDALWVTQIAYPFASASTSTAAVVPYRRHSYDVAGVRTWRAWESMSPVPVGSSIIVNGNVAPPGFLKENGALISRATYPALYAYAVTSGNIVTEAAWPSGNQGSFSTGDLSTTFRIPDSRGEFIRGWDDSRGLDSGRAIGTHQADSLKDHTHSYSVWGSATAVIGAANFSQPTGNTSANTSSPSTGAAAETRPVNVSKLICIKY